MLQFLIVLAILAIVVLVVSAPLRRAWAAPPTGVDARIDEASGEAQGAGASEIADLEAARDAKYREIRDAELDHRTGKLSDADFEAVVRGLRAEAIEILHELDRARGGDGDREGGGDGDHEGGGDAAVPIRGEGGDVAVPIRGEGGDAAVPIRREGVGEGDRPPGRSRI